VTLLESALVAVPSVVGWLRPVILVPACVLSGLTPEQFEAVLAHELAHIRRHDYLVNLAQTVLETILFYHPAVWWISRRIRLEREYCCDDMVLKMNVGTRDYALALVTLEQTRLALPGMMLALHGPQGGSLMKRIQRMMGLQPAEPVFTARSWAGALTLLALGLGAAGMMSAGPESAKAAQSTAPAAATAAPATPSNPNAPNVAGYVDFDINRLAYKVAEKIDINLDAVTLGVLMGAADNLDPEIKQALTGSGLKYLRIQVFSGIESDGGPLNFQVGQMVDKLQKAEWKPIVTASAADNNVNILLKPHPIDQQKVVGVAGFVQQGKDLTYFNLAGGIDVQELGKHLGSLGGKFFNGKLDLAQVGAMLQGKPLGDSGSSAAGADPRGAGAGGVLPDNDKLISMNRGETVKIRNTEITLIRLQPNNLQDLNDDSAEFSIVTDRGVSNVTLRKLETQFIGDLQFTAVEVRALISNGAATGDGTATIRAKYVGAVDNTAPTTPPPAAPNVSLMSPEKVKARATQTQIGIIATALEMFKVDTGRYPTTAEGLAALIEKPANLSTELWHGPYIMGGPEKKLPLDAWDRPYRYDYPAKSGAGYAIRSAGPDGQYDTPDDVIRLSADFAAISPAGTPPQAASGPAPGATPQAQEVLMFNRGDEKTFRDIKIRMVRVQLNNTQDIHDDSAEFEVVMPQHGPQTMTLREIDRKSVV
jgi:type II secretion system protein G